MNERGSGAAPLMLSVSGARGIVGRTMTPEVAARFAASFGMELRHESGKSQPVVVIGRDGRASGKQLARAAAQGLSGTGCRVIMHGIITTPTTAVMIDTHCADGGMVVTASHNPSEWNGLKCLNADGVAPPPAVASRIIDRFRSSERAPGETDSGSIEERPADEAHQTHIRRVLDNVDGGAIRGAGFRVVLDSINGAGCQPGRMLLEALGVEVVHLNGEPCGQFTHRPEPVREHLTDLAAAVQHHHAHLGFAQDPDADRLAIIDEHGSYIGEEYTLALAARRILDRMGEQARGAKLAANLSTSRMIDDLAVAKGAKVFRSPVGEANVVEVMKRESCTLGGEGNGGVIWPPICLVRDSLSAMALALESLASDELSLSELVQTIPRYAIEKTKVDIRPGLAEKVIAALANRYADHHLDYQDGLRVDFEADQSWLHVRPSNTEPIFRLIAEAPTSEAAQSLLAEAADVVADS